MLAENNQYIKDAVVTVRQLTQEEKIRQQCEAREDYYRHNWLLPTLNTVWVYFSKMEIPCSMYRESF